MSLYVILSELLPAEPLGVEYDDSLLTAIIMGDGWFTRQIQGVACELIKDNVDT